MRMDRTDWLLLLLMAVLLASLGVISRVQGRLEAEAACKEMRR